MDSVTVSISEVSTFADDADCTSPSHTMEYWTGAPLSATSYTIIGVYMIIACSVSFVGNTTLGVMMLQTGMWKRPGFNMYVFTIILVCLIESIAAFPLVIASNLKGWYFSTLTSHSRYTTSIGPFTGGGFPIDASKLTHNPYALARSWSACEWLYGELGCTYYAFITYTCGLVAMTCYVLVSVHRFRVVVLSAPADSPETRRWIACSIVYACTYCLCWSVCPFLGWGRFSLEPYATSCSLDWTSKSISVKMYNMLVFVFMFILPIAIMTSCYVSVIKKVRGQVEPAVEGTNREPSANNNAGQNSDSNNISHKRIVTARTLKIIFTSLVTYVLIWSPYGIMTMLANFDVPIDPSFSALPTIMAKTHSAINPIIYFLFFKRYRMPVRELFGLGEPS